MNRFALKNSIQLFLIVALFLSTTIITFLGVIMNPASAQDSKPTIVLVHGAFAFSRANRSNPLPLPYRW